MFDRIGGIGIVRKYQRNDGTFDYTVKSPRGRYSIEEFLDQYNENFEKSSQQERLDLLQQALRVVEAHQNGSDEIVFGMAKSVSVSRQRSQRRSERLGGRLKQQNQLSKQQR